MNNIKKPLSDLETFREAKLSAITNFKTLYELNKSLINLRKALSEYHSNSKVFDEYEQGLNSSNEKCSRIINVLERKQMKCAFFGRTSNGKSSVINSMLGQKILPYGIGHTTNCFVQIQGTSETDGYIIKSRNSNLEMSNYKMDVISDSEKLPIKSVHDLSHALSVDKVSNESLIMLYWPHRNCNLLKAEVTLLDSPGIDIDPDLDYWINHNCLDADVFVLVANAESTLTQTEKLFFHKVKDLLSNPNIFILNNRWDVCDNEEDYVAAAKLQHEQRCIDFLTKELEVCTYQEALERVFFISAKEMLECRTNENNVQQTDGKFRERFTSFLEFERSLEKNLCASALKTKFSSHSLQGREIIDNMMSTIDEIREKISKNLKLSVDKKMQKSVIFQNIQSGMVKTNETVSKQMSTVLSNILSSVVECLRLEIRQLHYIVKSFSSKFEPEPSFLLIYKGELNNYVENEMNKRISSLCIGAVKDEMNNFKSFLIDEYNSLIGYPIDRSVVDVIGRINDHELSIPCNSIFANFKEDLSFQWPFSPKALLSNAFMISYEARNQISMNYTESNSQSIRGRLSSFRPIMSQFWDSFVNKEFLGFCVISIAIYKTTGFRAITSTLMSYGVLYIFERLRWSRDVQECNFKNQYVKYASNQLTNMIDICTRSYSCVIKQDLLMNHKAMNQFVDNELSRCDREIRKSESEIRNLNEFLNTAESLKSNAVGIKEGLVKFKESYL